MRVLRWTPLLLLLLVPALARAATFNVDAGTGGNNVFTPNARTVAVGDAVTFTRVAGRHNVHFAGDSQPLTPLTDTNSNLGSRTFTAAGSYVYYCDLHGTATGGMRGTITVTAPAPGPTPTATATAVPGPGTPTPTPGGKATPTPGPGTSATPGPSGSDTPAVSLGQVARKVKRGRVRGEVTVAPSGRSYSITVKARGKRAGRLTGTSTGEAQRFAIRLSKAARNRLAHHGKLKLTITVRSGDLSAKRTVTVK